MQTSYTNHKQTLIRYLLQYYFSVYYIWFVQFWAVIFCGVNGVEDIMGYWPGTSISVWEAKKKKKEILIAV